MEPIYGPHPDGKRRIRYTLVRTNGPTTDEVPDGLEQPPYGYKYEIAEIVAGPKDDKQETPAQIVAAYKRGGISLEKYYERMDAAGVSPEAAETYVAGVRVTGGGTGGRSRAPRYPDEEEEAQLRNEMLRAQLAKLGMSAEDTAFEREYRSQRDAINDAFKEAQFAYQKATDTRNFAEQQRQFDLMQKLREQAAALDEKQFQVQTELGYANSRRQDLGVNLQRAETLGYDPDGATGVAPGTLTARAKQQQYSNVLGIQDREEQRALQEQARKDQQEQQDFQRGVTIRQLDEGDAAREEQESGVRLDRALRVAAMSKRPAYGRIR